MLAGQLVPGAGSGIVLGGYLRRGVDQHVALSCAHIGIAEIGDDALVERPLPQIMFRVQQDRAAEVLDLHPVVNQDKLAFKLVEIGLDEGVLQLLIGGEQALLQLALQAAFHVQVVDTAQHQHRQKQQYQPQSHASNQGPVLRGNNPLVALGQSRPPATVRCDVVSEYQPRLMASKRKLVMRSTRGNWLRC
ncbi:hypothetical protein D3C76_1156280 [compost metagenome]